MNVVGEMARILIVDDHPATRALISVLLQQLGYHNSLSVRNGVEALVELKKGKYNLILSDWTMPEMDGLTLWGRIKEDEALRNTPFVLITAMNEIEMVKKAISEGVTDYIVKPITLQALTSKVVAALSRNQNI
jgi:two-component system, chemotaxis family, chemotaxis protein CheY